jgi:formate transporter
LNKLVLTGSHFIAKDNIGNKAMENFNVDAYKPKEIADRIEQISVSKSVTDPLRVFALALLAGAFIAFGSAFFTVVTHGSNMSMGITRLLGGLVFCLGLILVVVAGAELFTGNNLLVMACVDKKITLKQLLLNWTVVFFGNLCGALGVVLLIYFSGHWLMGNGAVGAQAVMIANSKVNLGFMQAFTSGILCNALVCLAVWLCFASHTVTDKILAIIFPITAFVTLGFEHSVANMYFIPAGIVAKTNQEILKIVGDSIDLSNLNSVGFIFNLIPVTLGNIMGGSIFVGMIYWFIYLRN